VRVPGNIEFSSPPAPETGPVNPVGAAIIAIAADKAGKGDSLRACPVSKIACADWQRHAGFKSRLERDGGVEQ
jgi:hypothetical protein